MTLRVLSQAQKAAVVLLSVGPERAARVLSYLDEDEVERAAVEISSLGEISFSQLESVLHQFRVELQAKDHFLRGSEQLAREMLRQLHGSAADDVFDAFASADRDTPFRYVLMHDPERAAEILRPEQPQTIALVLSYLPPAAAGRVLGLLPEEVHGDVAIRMSTMGRVHPEALQRADRMLRSRFGETRGDEDVRRNRLKKVAQMLNQTERAVERRVMEHLETADAALADNVRALMFVFEDLLELDDRTLQVLLSHVAVERLALALKGTSTELRGKVLRNVSERVRVGVDEEMSLLGQVRISRVEEEQSHIVRLVHDLEAEGVLTVLRGDQDYVA